MSLWERNVGAVEHEMETPIQPAPEADEYEWTEIRSLDGRVVRRVGRCLHGRLEPVTISCGDVVAQLCLTCDEQLPAEWRP